MLTSPKDLNVSAYQRADSIGLSLKCANNTRAELEGMHEGKKKNGLNVAPRGLSIILVVMGHSGNEVMDHYLGWFRMPLFFLVSGRSAV